MADSQSNARPRACAGAPTSGVIHIRTRLTADFTVISNALAQRRGSAVTVGVATYILSLPDGSPVSIAALCEHFTEGEILISRALRELEAAGYLERRRERLPGGQIRTRTRLYDIPGGPPAAQEPPAHESPRPRRLRRRTLTAPTAPQPPDEPKTPAPSTETDPDVDTDTGADTGTETGTDANATTAPDTSPDTAPDPHALALLAALRRVDPRLFLSTQEAARLAPAVAKWLAAGVEAPELTALLTTRLPDRFLSRPAHVLAYRLRETPLPAPPPPSAPVVRPVALPFQTCDGCERAFRAPAPGHCRDCRDGCAEESLRAAG